MVSEIPSKLVSKHLQYIERDLYELYLLWVVDDIFKYILHILSKVTVLGDDLYNPEHLEVLPTESENTGHQTF